MSTISAHPNLNALDVPMDAWTQPFWAGTAEGKLLLPRCGACSRFRWPPGPFCPNCHSQNVEWVPSGTGRVYSFTIVRSASTPNGTQAFVPALIEFADADGMRLPAAIVDTVLESIRIGAALELSWSRAANATVPVFRISDLPICT